MGRPKGAAQSLTAQATCDERAFLEPALALDLGSPIACRSEARYSEQTRVVFCLNDIDENLKFPVPNLRTEICAECYITYFWY